MSERGAVSAAELSCAISLRALVGVGLSFSGPVTPDGRILRADVPPANRTRIEAGRFAAQGALMGAVALVLRRHRRLLRRHGRLN